MKYFAGQRLRINVPGYDETDTSCLLAAWVRCRVDLVFTNGGYTCVDLVLDDPIPGVAHVGETVGMALDLLGEDNVEEVQ